MRNKILYIALICCLLPTIIAAQQVADGEITVKEVTLNTSTDSIRISMDFDLSQLQLKSNRMIELFPFLQIDKETVKLPTVKIMGRRQYISHQRNWDPATWGKQLYWILRQKNTQQVVHYQTAIAAQKGTKSIRLFLDEDLCGCNRTVLASQQRLLAEKKTTPRKVVMKLAYLQPQIEVRKERNESGSAFISFPVNGTTILSDYQKNHIELEKIENTIKKVIKDEDIHIDNIQIKGFASPEGSLSSNERLAERRTKALVNYLVKNYQLDANLFTIKSGAEDWDGLRNFVSNSDLNEKTQMLAIINGKGSQDTREQRLRKEFPSAYTHLLKVCYPKLRHTDYMISYTIRAFNIEEAKRLIMVQPQKLSLNEIYKVAETYEQGSDAYNEVFEIAVRMFPEDEIANLNAANTALQRKDIETAEKYLKKADDCPEATVARGVAAFYKSDIEEAKRLFRQAINHHLTVATENLNQILEINK